MWGYNSELERTMVIGPPSDDQKRMFDHMVALQDLAFELIQPNIPCSEVDNGVRAYYEKHDLMSFWKHHVGHAIGLRYHEAPFLDKGDHTIIEPGMVFTVEPGVYGKFGGIRIEDDVVVTAKGCKPLTKAPAELIAI